MTTILTIIIALSLFAAPFAYAAQTACPEHFAGGQAPDFINQDIPEPQCRFFTFTRQIFSIVSPEFFQWIEGVVGKKQIKRENPVPTGALEATRK